MKKYQLVQKSTDLRLFKIYEVCDEFGGVFYLLKDKNHEVFNFRETGHYVVHFSPENIEQLTNQINKKILQNENAKLSSIFAGTAFDQFTVKDFFEQFEFQEV